MVHLPANYNLFLSEGGSDLTSCSGNPALLSGCRNKTKNSSVLKKKSTIQSPFLL
jgi:hypothetical protein